MSTTAADPRERFVTFSFAAADLLIEATLEGEISFATGAFQSLLGHPPSTFVGRKVRELVAPSDREGLDQALAILPRRGRQLPMTLRLADKARTPRALAGLLFAEPGRPPRLFLTFAALPLPLGAPVGGSAARPVMQAAAARLREGDGGRLDLIEITPSATGKTEQDAAVGAVLEGLVPNAVLGEIAPGRFGMVVGKDAADGILAVVAALESALHARGIAAAVASQTLALDAETLTPDQAARVLRHALGIFARDGVVGLAKAGFSDGLAGYVREATKHATALRRAIREERYLLAYQPIVRLGDRACHHYEALIRPQAIAGIDIGGPQDFVTLAETTGLAGELDLAVAMRAVAAAATAPAPIAFNLSSLSLQNEGFRARLLKELAGAAKGRLIVEMTETAEIEDVAAVRESAEALRGIGIPFCLDDFGAGSADMRILRTVPADYVKLDGSYVPGIVAPGRERDFVAAMAEITHAAGAAMIAERIESEAEADALHALGITYGQGWLFGRPGPLPTSSSAGAVARRRGAGAGKWE